MTHASNIRGAVCAAVCAAIFAAWAVALAAGCAAPSRATAPRNDGPRIEHRSLDADEATSKCEEFGCSK
jgi:hypothetical protein